MIRALREATFAIIAMVDEDLPAVRRYGVCMGSEIVTDVMSQVPVHTTFIILAVPDDAIEQVAGKLLREAPLGESTVIVHTSGAYSSDVLAPLRDKKAAVASMHPIQTFTGAANDWASVAGTYFGLEGDPAAVTRAQAMLSRIGSKFVLVPKEHKTVYHLACVFSSNYVVALCRASVELLQKAGFDEEQALRMLAPLLKNTAHNLARAGIQDSLTGPISRGDAGTVEKHLALLENAAPHLNHAYAELAYLLLHDASSRELIGPDAAKKLRAILNAAERTPPR